MYYSVKKIISLLIIACLFVSLAFAEIEFSNFTVATGFDGANGLSYGDIDNDGDMDLAGAAHESGVVSWFENIGNYNFTEHIITDDHNGAIAVYCVDIDADGDMDILSAARFGNLITCWYNDGEQNFTGTNIAENFEGASSVQVYDFDGDGDLDVLGSARYEDDIAWFENQGEGTFAEHVIDGSVDGALSAVAADLDNDDDLDVIGVNQTDGEVLYFINNGNQQFTDHVLKSEFLGAWDVNVGDMDSDGDIDILGVARLQPLNGDDVILWENLGDLDFEEHVIDNDFRYAVSVIAVDINEDGMLDIAAASYQNNMLTWWENTGELNFERYDIDNDIGGIFDVCFTDIDDDGDNDLIGAGYTDDLIILYQNHGNYDMHAPTEFSLLLPENNSTVTTMGPTLVWSASYDLDDLAIADFYIIYSVDDPTFVDLDTIEVFGDTTYTFEEETLQTIINEKQQSNSETDELLPNDVTIYWIVFATDDNTEGRWAIPTTGFQFDIDNQKSILNGTVRNANNNGIIPGAEIALYKTENDELINTVTTNAQGFYVFNEVLPATYYIEATSIHYVDQTVTDIVVPPSTTHTVNFTMIPETAVDEGNNSGIPKDFAINSVYPNPFNPEVNINISIPKAGSLELKLFNILGEEVSTIKHSQLYSAGIHNIRYINTDLSSGQYIIQARFDNTQVMQTKVTLVK